MAHLQLWKRIIWGTMFVVLGFVVYVNWAPHGLTYTRTFWESGSSAFISDFTPGDRVERLLCCAQAPHTKLVKDPVYLHVRSPHSFAYMDVHIVRGDWLQGLRIGLQTGPTREQFALFDAANADVSTSMDKHFVLPLTNGYRDAEGRYTLIFSFTEKNQPAIDEISIRFY